jgi:aspartate aminotransferase
VKLAARVANIKPSKILVITAKANALKTKGRDVISFGAGEPDFDTPAHTKQDAIKAIEAGFTKYTPAGGTDELKDAIINKLKRDNSLAYKRSQMVDWIRKDINLTSLKYQTIDHMIAAIGLPAD